MELECCIKKEYPGRIYVKKKTVPEFKAAKNRLNILLWRNAVAVHHLKPYLLYHSTNFSEFKDVSHFNL